ncbi:MAG: hypothetical protein M3N59_02255, partial [bacterium]|nr:hypothetical protein [bacterium]
MKRQIRKLLLASITLVAALAVFAAPAYANYVISAPTLFSTIDGGPDDADGVVNGCFVYSGGDFIVTATGSLLHNDNWSGSVPNSSARDICTNITAGGILIQGAVQAENLTSGGSGGNITMTASGSIELQGGATVSSSRVASGGTGNGGNITFITTDVDSEVAIDSGATVKADAANGNAGDISITAPKAITVDGTVSANGTGNSTGGDITLTATGPEGDTTIGTGGKVLSETATTRGGDITITAPRYISIDGTVSSKGSANGTGRGGAIWIDSGCTLTVGDNGIVSSEGKDAGADLVHLEGCDVFIYGLVQSTGPGHQPGNPNNNSVVARDCFDADGGDESNATRPDKPVNSTACVEIWAGGDLVIDSTGVHKGEVNADTAQSGGIQGIGWIDLIARGDITINGDSTGVFAIHANQTLGNGHGGPITI